MANISHFTQTVNGVSTTYDIHDANAIPRSGGAVMTGQSLSRTVDNSYLEINGSSNNGNGAYITLHGKNYDNALYAGSAYILVSDGSNTCYMLLKPDGTATWGNKEIDTIEEQGNNYIRYTSGLQICWGAYPSSSESEATINFPKAFISGFGYPLGVSVSGQSQTIFVIGWSSTQVIIRNANTGSFTYTAVGRWK